MLSRRVVFINILVFIVLFIIAELICRLFTAENKPFSERKQASILYSPSGFTRKWLNEGQTVYEVDNGAILKDKIKYEINQKGYRDTKDLSIAKSSQEIRIAILGGSHVFDLNCYNYQGMFGFPAMVEKALQSANLTHRYRIINAGEPGSDSRDFAAKIINQLSHYKPDYVIINSEWNDIKWIHELDTNTFINKTLPMAEEKNPLIEPVNNWDAFAGHSVIYRKLRDYYWKKKLHIGSLKIINEGAISTSAKNNADISAGLEQYRLNLASAIELIRTVHAIPVLAIEERLVSWTNTVEDKKKIQYAVAGVNSHEQLCSIYNSCDTVIRSLAREYHVPLIDANMAIGGKTVYFNDHVHTSPQGSKAIADLYYRYLVDSLHIDN